MMINDYDNNDSNVNIIKGKRKERENREKNAETRTIQPLTTRRPTLPVPEPRLLPPPGQPLPGSILGMTLHDMEYPFGQFESTLLAVPPPLPASCAPSRA